MLSSFRPHKEKGLDTFEDELVVDAMTTGTSLAQYGNLAQHTITRFCSQFLHRRSKHLTGDIAALAALDT